MLLQQQPTLAGFIYRATTMRVCDCQHQTGPSWRSEWLSLRKLHFSVG
jgi:hypothetical protein